MTDEERKNRLNIALDARRLEIENFWRRSLFFWGFIVAAFAGYAYTAQSPTRKAVLEAVLLHFGFLCSLCWCLVNKGSKYWQDNWERKVQRLESHSGLFTIQEPVRKQLFGAAKFSVTKITIFLSFITTICWVGLIANTYAEAGYELPLVLISLLSLVAAFLLFKFCKTAEVTPPRSAEDADPD